MRPPRSPRGRIRGRRLPARALVLPVVLFLLAAVTPATPAGAGSDGGSLRGFVLEPRPEVGMLGLPDASNGGAELTFAAEPGQLLLVYFGYTSCPDICPTTLADLRIALRKLGSRAERVQVAMVTVDPQRDTASVLDGYLGHFIRHGSHALRTDDDARLRAVADGFGAQYEVATDADGTVEVGHSAFVYAVDDQGVVQVAWPFGVPPKAVTHDLRILLKQARSAA